ncbi:transposable element Tcb1 transposase [Trichonephila clavipes]|nr:transposable element Tcb1 transposase [Trichonephila clavipes]
MIFYVVELLDDWNVDVPSWKYTRNLESPRESSPGFDNDSKMMRLYLSRHIWSLSLKPCSHVPRKEWYEQKIWSQNIPLEILQAIVRTLPCRLTHARSSKNANFSQMVIINQISGGRPTFLSLAPYMENLASRENPRTP